MKIKNLIKSITSDNFDLYDINNLQSVLIDLLSTNEENKAVFENYNIADVILRYRSSFYSSKKIDYTAYIICATLHEIFIRTAKESIFGENVLSKWSYLVKYLQIAVGYETIEQFRIVLLDRRHKFIKDEIMTKGTIDQAGVYNREVIAFAMRYNAKYIVIIHNHPSGDCSPSEADQRVTESVGFACGLHNIRLIDHLIVCSHNYFSFGNSLILTS